MWGVALIGRGPVVGVWMTVCRVDLARRNIFPRILLEIRSQFSQCVFNLDFYSGSYPSFAKQRNLTD